MFPPLMAGLHQKGKKKKGDGEGNHDDDVKHWASEESGIGRTEDFESIFGEATDAEAGRHARAVMWSVHRRLQRDDAMLLGYRTFARFLGYVVLFILVVYFQLQSLRSENRVQYGAVRSAVFGLDLNVTTDGSVDVSSHLASYAVLSDWVGESVIPGVWTLPSCGDAECTEELPGFDAGEGTRATFFQPQCPADCGVVETARREDGRRALQSAGPPVGLEVRDVLEEVQVRVVVGEALERHRGREERRRRLRGGRAERRHGRAPRPVVAELQRPHDVGQ